MTRENKRIPDWYRVEPYLGDESPDHREDEAGIVELELTNSNCDTYDDERSQSNWKQIRDLYFIYEPRCGHAIDYLVRNTDSKISIRTAKERSSQLARFVEFLRERDKCVTDAELVDVDEFFVEFCWMGITDSTFRRYRSGICNIYNHIELYRDESASVSRALILDAIDPSDYNTREENERNWLTPDELRKFLDAVSSFRNLLIIRVAVEIGPRNGDIAKLKVRDVDLNNQRLKITNTKSGESYKNYIPSELTMLLRRWIEVERPAFGVDDSNEYLFPNRYGGRLGVQRIGDIVHEAAEKAGIQHETGGGIPLSELQKELMGTEKEYRSLHRVDVHTLRHTYNVLLEKSGVSRESRSGALGHSTTAVTKEHYDRDEEQYLKEIENKFSGLPDFLE